jgi:serine/threonine protein kinase
MRDPEYFMPGIEIMASIHHPACLSLLAFSISSQSLKLVTEKMSTDLMQVIQLSARGSARPDWNDTAKSIVACGIAAGLAHLHSQNVIDRDVQPMTVFLDDNLYPRIGDFLVSRRLPPGKPLTLTFGVGTPRFYGA